VLAILASWRILPDNLALATTLGALVAIIGHNWSLFATLITGKLRGGKGAATAFGTLLVIAPFQIVLICFALAGAIIAITRLMSLGVLVMFAVALSWLTILILQSKMPPEFIIYTFNVAALIFLRFRENIDRLLKGTERRLGDPA
jgi:acyl phosphate:glycerol-3-phosphate acyltransferase